MSNAKHHLFIVFIIVLCANASFGGGRDLNSRGSLLGDNGLLLPQIVVPLAGPVVAAAAPVAVAVAMPAMVPLGAPLLAHATPAMRGRVIGLAAVIATFCVSTLYLAQNAQPPLAASRVDVPQRPIKSSTCESDADCGHGACSRGVSTCQCDVRWITPTNVAGGQCSYYQKSQTQIFILHAVMGIFGAGEFAGENFRYGFAQLTVTIGVAASGFRALTLWWRGEFDLAITISFLAAAIIAHGIWIADLVCWGRGDRTDGNGEKPYLDLNPEKS